jgi:hypothetical protein
MDKLPLRQTVIASTFFAAARTDAFTSPARFDFDFYSYTASNPPNYVKLPTANSEEPFLF